jgi:uncharacterized membrane protein YfcA
VAVAGAGVGMTFGVFGAGGSAFATPVLVLLGVPAPIALASPLPAMLPAAVVGAREYLRVGLLDRRVAKLAVLAGLPAVIAGAALSGFVAGTSLVALSGLMLFGVGVRIAWPTRTRPPPIPASLDTSIGCPATPEREGPAARLVIGLVAGAAFVTGLLANGGGFLLVPIFVLVLGLTAAQAAGTSMVAVAALMIPTLIAHWALGHVDWDLAAVFAAGVIPASILGARLGIRLPDVIARRTFGAVMVTFSVVFLALRVL